MKVPKPWSVYLVRCADRSLYTGIAKDVPARIAAHNEGRGAAYTRSRRPVKLMFHRNGFTHSAALIEEARIKSLDRAGKIALLAKSLRRTAIAAALLCIWSASARAVPTFNKETSISISSAVPLAFTGTYPSLRMYYMAAVSSDAPHASSGPAIYSALSADGISWTQDPGTRVSTWTLPSVSASSITGCAIGALSSGGYRMLYSIVSTTGAFRIHNATSADGLEWANQSAVAVDGGSNTYFGAPSLVILNSGDWRMYFTRDYNGGNQLADRRLFTARSTDEGASWNTPTLVLSTAAYESGASKLTDGRVRLFYTQPQGAASSATVILSALSTNALGTSFDEESGTRLSTPITSGAIAFPVPVRSTDSFRWRLYYSHYAAGRSTGDIHSALTGSPAPTSVVPSVIYKNYSTNTLAIVGEIFSSPTVAIMNGATTIVGTGVSSSDDMNISATFATQDQALGNWDVIVTNADGASTTLSSALLIDFAPGDVVLTNNLLRPRNGVPTSIAVTTYNAGHVLVRIYDTTGRPIRTLFDGERPEGTFAVTWDGKDASGGILASGVYAVVTTGPKIKTKSKVVLIR